MSLDITLTWKKSRKKFSDGLNITHNAGRIAQHVPVGDIEGKKITLYDVLWNHDDVKWKAGDIIKYLEIGIRYMLNNFNRLQRYETIVKQDIEITHDGKVRFIDRPEHMWYKWGQLEDKDEYGHRYGLIPFTEKLLLMCIEHPDATIDWDR